MCKKVSIFQFAGGGTIKTSPHFFKPKVRIFKQEVRIFNILEQDIFLKQIFKIFSLKMNPAKLVEKLEILLLSPRLSSFFFLLLVRLVIFICSPSAQ